MIVVPENIVPKTKSEEASLEGESHVKMEEPPPYFDSQQGSSSTQPLPRTLPDIKPSNYIYLSRANDSLKGSWIVDPAMVIPPTFLPPLSDGETEETRSNISLTSKNGTVSAEIYVLPTGKDALPTMTHRQKVIIRGSSQNGSVTLKIREVTTGSKRLPIHINGFSANGSVNVYVPRSFQGPVSVKTHDGSGMPRFSEPVKAKVTQFSEMNGVQRSFLGDFDANAIQNAGEWAGDTLMLESKNGNVKIYFNEEADATLRPKSQGFFGRLFSF